MLSRYSILLNKNFMEIATDHYTKEINPLSFIICQKIKEDILICYYRFLERADFRSFQLIQEGFLIS